MSPVRIGLEIVALPAERLDVGFTSMNRRALTRVEFHGI
jgi:hypothetical protein